MLSWGNHGLNLPHYLNCFLSICSGLWSLTVESYYLMHIWVKGIYHELESLGFEWESSGFQPALPHPLLEGDTDQLCPKPFPLSSRTHLLWVSYNWTSMWVSFGQWDMNATSRPGTQPSVFDPSYFLSSGLMLIIWLTLEIKCWLWQKWKLEGIRFSESPLGGEPFATQVLDCVSEKLMYFDWSHWDLGVHML